MNLIEMSDTTLLVVNSLVAGIALSALCFSIFFDDNDRYGH